MHFGSVGVVGGGAWGTALAQTVCRAGRKTLLWAREPDVVAEIAERRSNGAFLPGVALDPALGATADLRAVAAGLDAAEIPDAYGELFRYQRATLDYGIRSHELALTWLAELD